MLYDLSPEELSIQMLSLSIQMLCDLGSKEFSIQMLYLSIRMLCDLGPIILHTQMRPLAHSSTHLDVHLHT